MYLALRLSPESEQDIRNGLLWDKEEPVTPSDEFHLTVIHSPESTIKLKNHTSEAWDSLKAAGATLIDEPLVAHSEGLVTFGGRIKVAALKLNLTNRLDVFRTLAEAVLFEANIPWSTQWGFSPHVTLGRGKVKLTDTFPSVVTFNSMEWRE
jgi:2'-5' RNA ligase